MPAEDYIAPRKEWQKAIEESAHHARRSRDLLHEAGSKESDESGVYHLVDRLFLAARIHAELSTAAAIRAQAVVA